MKDGYAIEPARAADLAALPAIEQAANVLFEGTGLLPVVDDDFTAHEEFAAAQAAGRLWVARAPGGEPVGFALVELRDGQPHLEEMDVMPAHGRRGLGRALLEAIFAWGRGAGHGQLTLTTFRDLPWNAPFYARAGFRTLTPEELSPTLAAIVHEEAARGLDPAKRLVMRRALAKP
ncbi:MAG: GNAT family N-acetyltransferase [Myxococcota bacterium]